MGFKEAQLKCNPILLEPIMRVEVIVPEQFMGDITGSISGKRGQIEGMDERGLLKVVKAKVPLSEMFGYMTSLRSMTEGRAGFTMEFLRYDIVPRNVADEIVKTRTGELSVKVQDWVVLAEVADAEERQRGAAR